MKRIVSVVMLLSVILAFTGCSSSSSSYKHAPPKDWKADFLRQRDEAEGNVKLAKIRFKPGTEDMIQAQIRYQRARTCVNLLLEGIQSSIREGQNPMASPFYATRSRDAEEALLAFNNYVARAAAPPDLQPKFLPIVIPLVTSLGGMVWDKIVESSKHRGEERAAMYERAVADLNSVRFAEFVDIRQ